MNTIGKKNILFGISYFVTTLGLGMFLASKLGKADPDWMQSSVHHLLKAAHVHGNLESLVNILFGFLICRFGAKSEMLSKIASILFLIAAVFHSGLLYLGGLGLTFTLKLTPVGAFSLLTAIVLMIPVIANGLTSEK